MTYQTQNFKHEISITKEGRLILDQRIEHLTKIIKEKELAVRKGPKGSVHISVVGNKVRYYHSLNGKRKYIRCEEQEKIRALCQKDYDQKVLMAAKKELECLKTMKQEYVSPDCDALFETLHPVRKKFVTPLVLPDDLFAEQWKSQTYERKGFENTTSTFYTIQGERVRSKTEILIANELYRQNVPYKYECPLHLKGMGTVYPDFTVLNVRLRKEFYWEHMGMMDNAEYVEKALNKIHAYEQNNIFPGDNLIITHETSKIPIQSKNIEKMIQKYLK